MSEHIEFIDPATGTYYKVLAAKATLDAAYKLGFIPASDEDVEKVRVFDEEHPDE